MKTVKNWKALKNGVGVVDAINTLEFQEFNGITGDYAVKSEVTNRFLTSLDKKNERMTIPEIEGTWTIFVPDADRESKNEEIIRLAKESNATGISYAKLEHMSIEQIWEELSQYFKEDIKYKMLKWYFENKVYLKTLSTSKDKKKDICNMQGEDTGFVDAFGDHIYAGDIFVYKKYLPFKDPFGRTLVPDDIISNWDAYRDIVCLHPVFFDDDKHCWASDVYGDADPLSSYNANQIVVVTNIVDHPELYNH